MKNRMFDVVIVGGGISGCALTYVLSKYTDVKSIAILEKYGSLAPLNSNARANSQTLHCGDIETNYKLEKAKLVKCQANMLVQYASQVKQNNFLFKFPKMILAVDEEECDRLEARHKEFAKDFPYMKLWDAECIAKVEPAVALIDGKPRAEKILASGCTDEYCAINFGTLSKSFINSAHNCNAEVNVSLSSKVTKISPFDDHYELSTPQGTFIAKFVVVSAGAHSLLFANQLGHGLDMSILPMAGSFYYVPKMLNGKVYTMQNDKLPFAALHGDPDLLEMGKTRLGPTALVIPKLERHTDGTYLDFWKSLKLDGKVLRVFWNLMKDRTIRNYIFRNFAFEIPILRQKLFAKDAQKIIPSLKPEDLEYAKGMGGLRPQIINKTKMVLELGESSIVPEKGNLIFNITPSPGATTCLGNAYRDAQIITNRLGINLDHEHLVNDLLEGKNFS